MFRFPASDFCTAYKVTEAIKHVAGGAEIGRKPYKGGKSGSDPDTSNLHPARVPFIE